MSILKDALPHILPILTVIANHSLLTSVQFSVWTISSEPADYHVNNKKRLTEHQSGNKKLHSCETLNVKMTDKVPEAMNPKKLMLVVLLDLSKAFDSIKHCRHLSKLEYRHLKLGANSMWGVVLRPQALAWSLMVFHKAWYWRWLSLTYTHSQSCKVAHWNHLTLSYNYF